MAIDSINRVWCQTAANICLSLSYRLCLFLSLNKDTALLLHTKLVGIILQTSIIILFQISPKISSLCSILFFYAYDLIIILQLQVNH